MYLFINFVFINARSNKLGIEQYKMFLEELSKSKKIDVAEIKKKMANCGTPGVSAGSSGVRISKFIDLVLYIRNIKFHAKKKSKIFDQRINSIFTLSYRHTILIISYSYLYKNKLLYYNFFLCNYINRLER